ncbi:MAG: sulfatase-like hydrolase/transferase [Acidobacteria bacterium]|nr:sulfatase-like hydrolase/transferase [Acidobacteriota bacterium]
MTRRTFCSAALAATAACSSKTPEAAGPARRPNIVFCFADDWGRYASLYRDPARPGLSDVIETPHVDRVGREGVVFDNAFVAAPSCTPSRAAVTTGMYFFRCGRHANLRIRWPEGVEDPYLSLPSWPAILKEAGYHVGHAGKTTYRGKGDKAQKSYIGGQTPMSRFSQHASGEDQPAMTKDEIYAEVRETFQAFLADRPADAPFVYWFGPHNTHRPWVRGSGKALWGVDPDRLQGKLPAFLPDVPEVREDVADYLGETLAWDAMIGVLLAEIDQTGEAGDTLVVLSGDHGMPGVTHGKCNVYDFGVHAPLLARWPAAVPAGRRITDFVNMMDVAPTMVEAAGLQPPPTMQARSFLPQLRSSASGRIDPARDHVLIGRERHVEDARPDRLPYPTRALRTDDYLYIRNFKPDRWPMGDPGPVTADSAPSAEELAADTMVAFKDLDASPTKAWLIAHRNEPEGKRYYDYCFAKRPAEELYDLAKDPDQIENVAGRPEYAETLRRLSAQLQAELEAAGDPRLDDAFDRPPYVEESAS